jgi:general secretion pathway protein M
MELKNFRLNQRWLAVALLVFVMAALGLLIVMPLISVGLELNEEKQALIFKLQKYEKILALKDNVIAETETIKQQQEEQNYFNKQGTDALASAEMQELIKKTIVEAGGQLSSTQSIPVSEKDDFKHISVRVRMTANSEVLRSVLYKLETSSPLLVIDQLDIRPVRGRRNRITRQIEPSNELNINFQAVTFMRKKAA